MFSLICLISGVVIGVIAKDKLIELKDKIVNKFKK